MLIVTQADTVDGYLALRDDLMRTTYAASILELVDRFSIEDESNHALYQLLTDSLGRIANEPKALPVVLYFQMRLVDLMGFRPDLFHCIHCREEIQAEDQFFSPGQGGVFCPRCGIGVPGIRPVSMLALKYLRHFQRSNYLTARRAAISEDVLREMDGLMQDYLTYTLERKLNVPEFMRQVRD
jgi:DNA repair protein RecO (recombination protein O)